MPWAACVIFAWQEKTMKRAVRVALFVLVVIVAGLALGWAASLIVVAPAP